MDDDIKAVLEARQTLRTRAIVLVTVCGFLWLWLKTPGMDTGGNMKVPILDITTKDFNAGHVILLGPLLIFLWYLFNVSSCAQINEMRAEVVSRLIARRRDDAKDLSARERYALVEVANPASASRRRRFAWLGIGFQSLLMFWAPVITYCVIYGETFSVMQWEQDIDATHCVDPWNPISVARRNGDQALARRDELTSMRGDGCRVARRGEGERILYAAPAITQWFINDGSSFRACRAAGPYERNAEAACATMPTPPRITPAATAEQRRPVYDSFPYAYPLLQAWGYLILGIAMFAMAGYATITYLGLTQWWRYRAAFAASPTTRAFPPNDIQ